MKKSMIVCMTLALASVVFAKGEAQPGDVKGEGKGHKVVMSLAKGEAQPGDVKGEGKGHKIFLVREANEPPRGQDNERPGDRQRGRGKLVDDFQLAAREGNEGPRGNDSIAGSGRQRRIV